MYFGASQITQMVNNLPATQETQVQPLGLEDSLEMGMAIHSSILAWRISWTKKPSKLQFMASQRVRQNWASNTYRYIQTDTLKNFNNKATPLIQQVQEGYAETSPLSSWKQERTSPPSSPWNISFAHWKENDIDVVNGRELRMREFYTNTSC